MSEMVEREPTREEMEEYFLGLVGDGYTGNNPVIEAILRRLRIDVEWMLAVNKALLESQERLAAQVASLSSAPALVLSEGEREALQAGALALVVDAHDWRKLVLDLPEDKPDCARWIARSDQSENHAATLRAIASRGKL